MWYDNIHHILCFKVFDYSFVCDRRRSSNHHEKLNQNNSNNKNELIIKKSINLLETNKAAIIIIMRVVVRRCRLRGHLIVQVWIWLKICADLTKNKLRTQTHTLNTNKNKKIMTNHLNAGNVTDLSSSFSRTFFVRCAECGARTSQYNNNDQYFRI